MSQQRMTSEEEQQKNLIFANKLARYYMDFLETDFHRRRSPRRKVAYRNNKNLLIGVNLGKYPSFQTTIWKAIQEVFSKNPQTIAKGLHKTSVPKSLLKVIGLQIDNIEAETIEALLIEFIEALETALLHKYIRSNIKNSCENCLYLSPKF